MRRATAAPWRADPESLVVSSRVRTCRFSYLPGNNLSISVTVIGDLKAGMK